MFTVIVRALWCILLIVPLALAAFQVPAVNHQWLIGFGAGSTYAYAAFSLVPAMGMLMFVQLAQHGNVEAFNTIKSMLAAKDKHTLYTRLYLIAFIASAIILALAVEAFGAAITLAVAVIAHALVFGYAESAYDKLVIAGRFRGATRNPTGMRHGM